MTRSARYISLVVAVLITLFGSQAHAGQASGNLAVGITITSSCEFGASQTSSSYQVENRNCDGINAFRVDRESNGVRSESRIQTNAVAEVEGSKAAPTVVTLYW